MTVITCGPWDSTNPEERGAVAAVINESFEDEASSHRAAPEPPQKTGEGPWGTPGQLAPSSWPLT